MTSPGIQQNTAASTEALKRDLRTLQGRTRQPTSLTPSSTQEASSQDTSTLLIGGQSSEQAASEVSSSSVSTPNLLINVTSQLTRSAEAHASETNLTLQTQLENTTEKCEYQGLRTAGIMFGATAISYAICPASLIVSPFLFAILWMSKSDITSKFFNSWDTYAQLTLKQLKQQIQIKQATLRKKRDALAKRPDTTLQAQLLPKIDKSITLADNNTSNQTFSLYYLMNTAYSIFRSAEKTTQLSISAGVGTFILGSVFKSMTGMAIGGSYLQNISYWIPTAIPILSQAADKALMITRPAYTELLQKNEQLDSALKSLEFIDL